VEAVYIYIWAAHYQIRRPAVVNPRAGEGHLRISAHQHGNGFKQVVQAYRQCPIRSNVKIFNEQTLWLA
jgi:hypothetical protein